MPYFEKSPTVGFATGNNSSVFVSALLISYRAEGQQSAISFFDIVLLFYSKELSYGGVTAQVEQVEKGIHTD
jgi:hypothetical protein